MDHAVRSYGKTYGLNYLITNCSNNYGLYQYSEKLIPVVILKFLKKEPITVYGKEINVRNWIHVQDHVDAIYKICLSNFKKETFLIGGGNKILNIKLVYKICEKFDEITRSLNSKKLINFISDRPGHDLRYAINNSLCKKNKLRTKN